MKRARKIASYLSVLVARRLKLGVEEEEGPVTSKDNAILVTFSLAFGCYENFMKFNKDPKLN